jgi:hypothetical protein
MQLVPKGGLSWGVKRSRHEADQPPSTSAAINIVRGYTSSWRDAYLINQDKFTFNTLSTYKHDDYMKFWGYV